jgi:hypothetical protein
MNHQSLIYRGERDLKAGLSLRDDEEYAGVRAPAGILDKTVSTFSDTLRAQHQWSTRPRTHHTSLVELPKTSMQASSLHYTYDQFSYQFSL